jgi:uncharacterized membrane protein YdjX (TVP38/TMEM64 family)
MGLRSATRCTGSVWIRALAVVLGIVALVVLQLTLDIFSYFSQERIQGWLTAAGPAAPIVFMLVMTSAIVISPIPSLPLDIAAGVFFGPLLGTLYSAIGALGGSVVSFMIARLLGRELVARLLRGHIVFCTGCSDRILTKVVFLSRLIPVVSFDVVSYGAGLTAMSLGKFALATFLGMLPLTFVYNYFGSVLVVQGWVSALVAGVFVLLFFLIPRLIERHNLFNLRRYFRHSPATTESSPAKCRWT